MGLESNDTSLILLPTPAALIAEATPTASGPEVAYSTLRSGFPWIRAAATVAAVAVLFCAYCGSRILRFG